VTEFWYAWRGGPQILRASAKSDFLLMAEIERLLPAAVSAYEEARRPQDKRFLYGLITRYLQSPEFEALGERTKKDRRKFLDRARRDLGEMELRALEARSARHFLIQWRDGFRRTPKTADELLGAVGVVLQWAADRGEIRDNPVKDFPRIYRSDRADVIWTAENLAEIKPHCAPELDHAIRLAALSGLRLGDLIEVTWSAVGEHAIIWQTNKSRRRRTVVVPIYDELRALLAEVPRTNSVTILNSARGRPWTESGLESALRRARLDAKAAAAEQGLAYGLEGLRFHDLRGTAVTNFVRAGIDLGDVATIVGWKKARVEEIAARYVTAEAIGMAIVEKLRRNKAQT
jgi:integrase